MLNLGVNVKTSVLHSRFTLENKHYNRLIFAKILSFNNIVNITSNYYKDTMSPELEENLFHKLKKLNQEIFKKRPLI